MADDLDPCSDAGAAHVLWLYGVTYADQALPAGCPASVEAIRHHAFSAIVERVPRAEFTPEVIEARMESMEWVAAPARRHQGVLDALLAKGPVIPARLCTLFSSPSAVEDALEAGHTRFSASLDRLTGCREWGLKLFCDERRLAANLLAETDESGDPSLSPGRAYVLAKQREARATERAAERVDEIVDEVVDALEPHLVDVVERAAVQAPPDGTTAAMNLAVLLTRGGEEAFRAAVEAEAERLALEGCRFELSGPWAPYGFCNLDAPARA
jgi:hypothetical protein